MSIIMKYFVWKGNILFYNVVLQNGKVIKLSELFSIWSRYLPARYPTSEEASAAAAPALSPNASPTGPPAAAPATAPSTPYVPQRSLHTEHHLSLHYILHTSSLCQYEVLTSQRRRGDGAPTPRCRRLPGRLWTPRAPCVRRSENIV